MSSPAMPNRLRSLARSTRVALGIFTVLILATSCDDESKSESDGDNSMIDNFEADQPSCTAGTQGCECAAGDECVAGLTCVANVCDVACTAGSLNCICAAGNTCSNASDECVAGTCVPRTGCDGELGCPCDAGGGCTDAGASCVDSTCRIPNGVLVEVSGGDARACDVVVETLSGRFVDSATFVAGVRGQTRVRNERGSVALIRTEDSALEGVVGTLVLDGPDAADPADVTIRSASCYGRLGAADAAATVTLR